MDRRKENWHISKSINVSVLVTLALCTVSTIVYVTKIDYKVDSLDVKVNEHHLNENAHMPFEEKIKVFVPRVELEKELTAIRQSQDEIKADVKELLRAVK